MPAALASDPVLQLQQVTAVPKLSPLPLHIGGRGLAQTEAGGEAWLSQWPGAYFEAAFQGSTVFFRVGPNHEILHIVVDHDAPLTLKVPSPGMYRLSGLSKASHTIRVLVATESMSAPNTFDGFGIPTGERALPAPAPRPRQIEFIGDSHTVGYGNTSPTQTCTQDQVWATTDNTQAFAALTAANVHADYQVNAISGRGIVRNYNNVPGDTLPVAYPYTLLNDKQHRYADPNWRPELLVIALGTNDFSTPLNPNEPWKTRDQLHADFEAAYVRFLQSLRGGHPNAWIILWAADKANGEIESEVQKVVDQAKAKGLTRLDYIPFNDLAFTACHGHPSLADHQAIANRLTTWINAHPGLW